MAKKQKVTKLGYTQGSSDKVYEITLSGASKNWSVTAQYGRRHKIMSRITAEKCKNEPFEEAEHLFNTIVQQKKNKGYKVEMSYEW